jgi:hypothetical protein
MRGCYGGWAQCHHGTPAVSLSPTGRGNMEQTRAEAALAAQPETAAKIDQFLANPDTGIRIPRPSTRDEADNLLLALRGYGYEVEPVGDAADDGTIVNLLREGEYLLTLTITRTPGY